MKELVCNSIDAKASSVAVRLDLDILSIRIQVVDDGRGMTKDDLLVAGRQFSSSKRDRRVLALASVRREAKLVNITTKTEAEKTWKTEFVRGRRGEVNMGEIDRSCSWTTVTVSGFLWNQEVKMVKEVADVMEVKNGLLAIALVYPMVRFSLRNDTEGGMKVVLNTPRMESAVEAFRGVFGSNLGDSVREVQYEDREEDIRISGFIPLSPHHTRDLQFFSVNKQSISTWSCTRLVQEGQNLFKTGHLL